MKGLFLTMKNMMRRLFSTTVLALCLSFSLVGCSGAGIDVNISGDEDVSVSLGKNGIDVDVKTGDVDTDVDVDTGDMDVDTGIDSDDYVTHTFASKEKLENHFEKHGKEMGFESSEEYEKAANNVVNNKAALHKLEAEDGDDVYYLEETNEFVIVSEKGYIRTYFNPNDGIDYYNRQ